MICPACHVRVPLASRHECPKDETKIVQSPPVWNAPPKMAEPPQLRNKAFYEEIGRAAPAFDGVAKPNVAHLFAPPTSIPPEEVQKRKGIFDGVAELAASLPPPTPEELAELEHARALEELERNRREGIEIRARILAATKDLAPPRLVIIESPFAGDVVRNTLYARAALRDSLLRGEAPLASHLLYTQQGVLDDGNPEERDRGIAAGLAWGPSADASVVYVDLGISRGMRLGIERAEQEGRPVEYRSLPDWANTAAPNAAR